MAKTVLILVSLLLLNIPAFAQDILWSRAYEASFEDWGFCVQQTFDGGYIVTGATGLQWTIPLYPDVYLIKTDFLGDTLWSCTYGGSNDDWALAVQQTSDRGYIVAGGTQSFDADGVYLIKTDSLGDTLWSRTFGGVGLDAGHSVQQTTDGGYIVAGAGYDFWLIKTDSLGDTLWIRAYGGSGLDAAYFVQQTQDGGYVMAGYTESFGSGLSDFYLIKTDLLGDTLWSRTFGGIYNDRAFGAEQTTDGGYIVAGWTQSFGDISGDVWLIKTDSLGGILWSRTYESGGSESGRSIRQTSDGGYIVVGGEYLTKTDSLGGALWTRTCGEKLFWGPGNSVQQTSDGGYIVAGVLDHYDLYGSNLGLVKLDAFGNTCTGEFVTSTVVSVSCSVTSPPTVVTSPSCVVTSPVTQVTSPVSKVALVCELMLICGDVNGDGAINLSDPRYLANYKLKGGPAPASEWASDVNCDSNLDLGDVMIIAKYYLGKPGFTLNCCP